MFLRSRGEQRWTGLFAQLNTRGEAENFESQNFIALRASAAVPPLICALDADLGAMGAGGRAVVYGAAGHAAGARLR